MAVLRSRRSRKFIRCHWVLLPNGLSASQPHSGQASQLFFFHVYRSSQAHASCAEYLALKRIHPVQLPNSGLMSGFSPVIMRKIYAEFNSHSQEDSPLNTVAR